MTEINFLREAEDNRHMMEEARHYLHAHPETGFDLAGTVAFVKKQLADMGYEPKECGRAGLVVTAGGRHPGKVFMIRADMDALPVAEESGVEFASDNGKMHACGHDMHAAMLLGAAKILKAHEDQIQGTVKLMFQPAEEIFQGSDDMIKAGLLENPHVDAALMIHVMAGVPFPIGTAVVCDGGVSAPAADTFEIKIQGKGCHGSMPNNGIDPITAAAHIITALQEIHARELAMVDEAVLTIGSIHAGVAPNVIPDTAVLAGTIRTYDEEIRQLLKTRMEEISGAVASAFRASAQVTYGSGCPTLLNDAGLSADVTGYIRELNGPGKCFTTGQLQAMSGGGGTSKSTGSEDFAYVSHQVPSIMLALAAGGPAEGCAYPQHHPKARFSDEALAGGSAIYAYTAMRWLEDHR